MVGDRGRTAGPVLGGWSLRPLPRLPLVGALHRCLGLCCTCTEWVQSGCLPLCPCRRCGDGTAGIVLARVEMSILCAPISLFLAHPSLEKLQWQQR